MTPISARSRRPTRDGTSVSEPADNVTFRIILMLASSCRACSSVSIVVLPRSTTYFGPWTAWAGLIARTWPTTSQSSSILIAAKCCLTIGFDATRCLMQRIAGLGHRQRLEVGGDMKRLDIGEFADTMLIELGKERANGPVMGHARVVVLDRGGEKIEKPLYRPAAGVGDHRRHRSRTVQRRRPDRRCAVKDRRQVVPAGRSR